MRWTSSIRFEGSPSRPITALLDVDCGNFTCVFLWVFFKLKREFSAGVTERMDAGVSYTHSEAGRAVFLTALTIEGMNPFFIVRVSCLPSCTKSSPSLRSQYPIVTLSSITHASIDRHRTMLADFDRLDLLHAPFSWPGLDSEAGQISHKPCGLQEPEWFHQVMCMKHYRCCESTCLIFCALFPESSNMQMTCKLHFLSVKMLQLFVTVVFIVINSNGTCFSAYQITYK